MKLERALRHLSAEHKLEIEALTAKLEQKSLECKSHMSVTAANADILVGKDREVDQLKKKVSDCAVIRCYHILLRHWQC